MNLSLSNVGREYFPKHFFSLEKVPLCVFPSWDLSKLLFSVIFEGQTGKKLFLFL